MVGVGVAEGGAGVPGPGEYYGEYYPAEPFFVPPEMCPHPQQHPQHAHMCTVMPEYGAMPVVTSGTMMPALMPPVMDENMRHYLVRGPPHHHPQHHQPPPHHQQPHHQPPHHQPPPHHHQPPHHFGPTNGAAGPQHFYGPGYPPHFHPVPPQHMQHSPPPPPVYQKDERTQRQYSKLKQKLERKQNNKNNGVVAVEPSSGTSTPSLSPRKELNGRGSGSAGASSGTWSEGEGSSAGASVQGDDETNNDTQQTLDLLTAARTPHVDDMTPTSALVTWNSPIPENVTLPNIELTYDLLLGDRGRYKAIYSGSSLSCRVRDLRPGCEYSVCLQIRAGEVTGAASEAVTFRAPAAPPDRAPAPRLTQRTRTTLLLRWPAPNDNGDRITHYLLEIDAGGGYVELARPRSRQHAATELTPHTRYRFRLAAVNECGAGAWSEETVAWTAGLPPPAPPPPALLAAAANALALTWERRDDEEFTLQMDDALRGHGFLPVYSGGDDSYECVGLRRATDYRFRLRCETVDGQGPWSTDVTYRTLPERPAPPGRPTPRGKIHSRAFRLRWEPPVDDGGAPVQCYTLELDAGEGYRPAYSGREREAHCDRLQPGTEYRARVRCANDAGESEWSAAETVATEAAVPGACEAPELSGATRATQAAVRWRAPDCTGGAPLTEYRVDLCQTDGEPVLAYRGRDCEYVLRDLTPGTNYTVTVTASNRAGAGPTSPHLEFTTAPAPPDAPSAPLATMQPPRGVRLEWITPAENGAPILHYRLEMSASAAHDAFAEIYRGTETNYAVENLTPFSAYFFRVCASNAAGRGAWSGIRDVVTPRSTPGAPSGVRHDATATSLRLYWRAPAAHGADVLRYRVQLDGDAFDTDGPATERLVEGLAPDTVYRVRVAAHNELGLGDWSEEARAATRPPPPEPPALRLAQTAHNYLRLEWDAVGDEGATYCVEMRAAAEFRPVYRGSARFCKVKKLRESTQYAFRIRASSERGGRGECSPALEARTSAAPPPAPRTPALSSPAPRAVLAAWDAIDDATYVLQCARAREPLYKQVYSGSENHFQIEELEQGAEYLVRVCAVRGTGANSVTSAWSPAARLTVPIATRTTAPRARRARACQPRALQPRQAALAMAGVFLLVAVLVAVLLQRFVEPRP